MYDDKFYEVSRKGMQDSAAALVPILVDLLGMKPLERLIDVGCGEGWWAAEFQKTASMVTLGVDGAYVDASRSGISKSDCDLNEPLPFSNFEYALSLEVAEHLRPERAAGFITDLCAMAPVVIFSAAIPGQGGTGHINEQWPDYWAEHFRSNGYRVNGDLRLEIWNDDRIENWYRQNLMIAWDSDTFEVFDIAGDDYLEPILPLVHPVLWDARR